MANLLQKIIGGGLGIPIDPDWSWKDKGPPSGSVGEKPNISPAPDRVIRASGESMLSPAYARWMEKYGYDYNPDGTPKYDVGYDPQERAKKIGYDKYRPNVMKPREIETWRKGYEKDRLAKEKYEKEIADAKKKAEEEAAFLDSPKGRLQTLWADADKRDAILGGITDAMTEVKFGQDAYQSRFYDTQKKIRQNLKMAEITKLAKQKAQLDMFKVAAETSVLANPAQYLTTAQKNAMDIVTKSGLRPGSPEWNQAYSQQLQQIVVKDLTSAKASALTPLYTFAKTMINSEDAQERLTAETMMKAIESIAGYLAGTDIGGGKSQRAEIIVEEETTTTPS
jgi:hypothetical protein